MSIGNSQWTGMQIQQTNQMLQRKVMMEAGNVQKNEKNKSRAKGYMIGVGLFFLLAILLLVVLLLPQKKEAPELRFENLLTEEGTLEREHFASAVEDVLGTDYLTYMDELSEAIEKDDYADVLFSLEGADVYVVFANKPDAKEDIRAVYFTLKNNDKSAQEWYDYTQKVTEALTAKAANVEHSSYYFDGGKISLEWGPVDESEITVHEDGSSSWSGVPGEYGTRITNVWVDFD